MNTSTVWQEVTEFLTSIADYKFVGTMLELPEKGDNDQQKYLEMLQFLASVITQQGLRLRQTSTEEMTIAPATIKFPGHNIYLCSNGEGINYFYVFTTKSCRKVLLRFPNAVCPDQEELAGWVVTMVSQIGGVNVGVIFLDQDASIRYLRERM